MKRIYSLLLAAALCLGLAACGKPQEAEPIQAVGRWVQEELPDAGEGRAVGLSAAPDGTLQYVTRSIEGENQVLTLHRSADGEAWTEAPIDWGGGDHRLTGVFSALPNGSLWGTDGKNLLVIQPDGTAEVRAVAGADALCAVWAVTENTVLVDASEMHSGPYLLLDAQTGQKRMQVEGPDFFTGAASDGSRLQWLEETGLVQLDESGKRSERRLSLELTWTEAGAADAEGNYYFANAKGLHRVAKDGSLLETLLEGPDYNFSNDLGTAEYLACRDGAFYLAIAEEQTQTARLFRYRFDETLPAASAEGLEVWSLQESPTVRAAITALRAQRPDLTVNYTVAGEGLDTDDQVRTLAAQLLAGSGPDVLILDGLDWQSFADKGVLSDLTQLAGQVEFLDALAPSGTVYTLAARFELPVLIGPAGQVEQLATLADVQALLEHEPGALPIYNLDEALDFMLDTMPQGSWTETGALETLFRFVQAAAPGFTDEAGEGGYLSDSDLFHGAADMVYVTPSQWALYSGDATYAWARFATPMACGFTTNFEDADAVGHVILRPGLAQGAWRPLVRVGVNASSARQEDAQAFVAALFRDDVQSRGLEDGMSVTKTGFAAGMERNQYFLENTRPGYEGDFRALAGTVKTPVDAAPQAVRQVLREQAQRCVSGEAEPAEAASRAAADLKLYTDERA